MLAIPSAIDRNRSQSTFEKANWKSTAARPVPPHILRNEVRDPTRASEGALENANDSMFRSALT